MKSKNKNKRKWGEVASNISLVSNEDSEDLWRELFEASGKTFQKLLRGYLMTGDHFKKNWGEVFFKEMCRRARCIAHWKKIAKYGIEFHPPYNKAIEIIYEDAKKSKVLYRWRELRKLIKCWHFLWPEVERRILELKK